MLVQAFVTTRRRLLARVIVVGLVGAVLPLLVSELGGRLQVMPRSDGGTEAVVSLPVGYE